MDKNQLIEGAIVIAKDAAKAIKAIYLAGQYDKEIKSDNTPVTSADLAAHKIIAEGLAKLSPDIPVLSEEDTEIPLSVRSQWQRYWLVDPLDGTQEFISRSGDFAVIIALVEKNQPAMGVVYAPMTDVCYYAVKGQGAFKRQADGQTNRINSTSFKVDKLTGLRLAVSRVQKTEFLLRHFSPDLKYDLIPLGSAALKSCLIAEGGADCYMRLGPTGEWDTGATQCIVEEAGGRIANFELQPLSYNQRESFENPNFVVIGEPNLDWQDIIKA
ncbi:3'(2'),5'-bisphosphate nucleotidase CysQ [Paraferrimonas sp. SM1919]|uniref:3'(2'),5'-bisphosphate nucleotidase CysQ n=1 Tax=Paraferrimonas sp. SM1919 TaxID=2662263 RepID=UPI0013D4A602|nr:3'(2'),5'-bisphosphate nucleotidase CysQ [Paraferrimonas sp. SM1919]